jgi:hypothetical protein
MADKTEIQPTVSFTYPTMLNDTTENEGIVGEPILDFCVKNLPTEFGLIAVSGLVGVSIDKSYSIDTNVYLNDKLVTDPRAESKLIEHRPNLSTEGLYVATLGIEIEKIKAESPGFYMLKTSLYENQDDAPRVLVDSKECLFAVSCHWDH